MRTNVSPKAFKLLIALCLFSILSMLVQLAMDLGNMSIQPHLALVKQQALIRQQKHSSTIHRAKTMLKKKKIRSNGSQGLRVIPRFAYVTYATNNIYACSGMIMLDSIRKTNASASIDLVIIHTNALSRASIAKIKANGMIPIQVDHVKTFGASGGSIWRDSMTKLNIFGLEQYQRIVYIDGDAMVLRNLDHLFELPRNFLYGVDAYWLPIRPFINSQFLVIEPKKSLLHDILQQQAAIEEARRTSQVEKFPDLALFEPHQVLYDMDILNVLYRKTISYLPSHYVVLNNVFVSRPNDRLREWKELTTQEVAEKAFVIHFTESPNGGYGKPWHSPTHRIKQPKDAHPLLKELFERFWKKEKELCVSQNS